MKSLLTLFLVMLGIFLHIPTYAQAAEVTNICGYTETFDGMSGDSLPPCEGSCTSDGSTGTCADQDIEGANDTFIDIQGCKTDQGNHNQCDGSPEGGFGSGIDNFNGGGSVSANSYLNYKGVDYCKIQLDVYKDDGIRKLVNFIVVREPANCGGGPPPEEPTDEPEPTITTPPGEPTNTPEPTPTTPPGEPSNTPVPDASPTPTLVASCLCDGMEYTNNISPGEVVTFTAHAKVEDPDNNDAKVLSMEYLVYVNGEKTTSSGLIDVTGPETGTDSSSKKIEKYKSSWQYQIPTAAPVPGKVLYMVEVKINCGYQSADGNIYTSCAKSDFIAGSEVLKGSKQSLLSKVFTTVFSAAYVFSPAPAVAAAPDPNAYYFPEGTNGIKLGKFHPLIDVEEHCTWVSFTITYS